MPIYEYRCSLCGTKFELIRPLRQADAAATCADCGGAARRLISRFSRVRSAGAETATAGSNGGSRCASCSGRSCASCR